MKPWQLFLIVAAMVIVGYLLIEGLRLIWQGCPDPTSTAGRVMLAGVRP